MNDTVISVGIVGYCAPMFDHDLAREYLKTEFDQLAKEQQAGLGKVCFVSIFFTSFDSLSQVKIVSGLTTAGVLGIAYTLAKEYNFITVGIAPKEALKYELFDVDEQIIVGEKFGEESQTFLQSLSRIIRIGGGPQSHNEIAMAKEDPFKQHITQVIEYNL
jgi:hypothetical protein